MRKFILIALLLSVIAFLATFAIIDYRVGRELYTRSPDSEAQVISDELRIDPSKPFHFDQLVRQLNNRRYREVTEEPQAPGEFSVTEHGITIHTREFTGLDNTLHPATRVVLTPGKLPNEPFFIEPVLVATLGQGDIRADSVSSLDDFPDSLKRAVVAIEDERFIHHFGIDLEGIVRAVVTNLRSGSLVQGGSTITQQLAKNLFFSPERSLRRKILEMFAALSLERRLSKEQILEMYLNEIYLGQEGSVAIHGFTEAANVFFGKKISDLSVPESALLAGIIKAPSYFSPRRHPERAKERRDVVLHKMRELRYLTSEELSTAIATPITIVAQKLYKRSAPHYIEAIRQDLSERVYLDAASRHGLTVYGTLDIDYQECGENAVRTGIEALEKRFERLKRAGSPLEGALVAIEPFSGKIRAWVGGRDFSQNQFDHVSQAKRQIGSTIKPFLYVTALESGGKWGEPLTPLSILSDRPIKLNLPTKQVWEPENYDRDFYGDVTLRFALEKSLNLATVSLEQKIGIDAFVDAVTEFNLGDSIPAVPALALGATDTTLLRLTSAYGAIANGGIYVSPRMYLAASSKDQNVSVTSPIQEVRVANEDAVSVLTNILQGVVERGTAKGVRALGYSFPVAGKTGTSNDTRDAWFVGFSPDLVAGVWVGFDDNKKVGLTGGVAAVPIWTEFMQCVARYHNPERFIRSKGTEIVDIDVDSGERATPDCPSSQVTREMFVQGTAPARYCHLHSEQPDFVPSSPTRPDSYETPRPRKRRNFWERIFG